MLIVILVIGEYTPDWLSQQKDWLPDEDRKVWEDHGSEFRGKLDRLLRPGDIDPKEVCNHICVDWSLLDVQENRGTRHGCICHLVVRNKELTLCDAVRPVLRLSRPREFDRLSERKGPARHRCEHVYWRRHYFCGVSFIRQVLAFDLSLSLHSLPLLMR